MLDTHFPDWPSYSQEEIDAVSKVLVSNRVNQWTGDEVNAFESEFAAYVGSSHAVAIANGTLALDSALMALGLGSGDEVIVTPRTYIASVSSVVAIGATPVFADVCQETQNLCLSSAESLITAQTKALIVVHLAGMPSDMDAVMSFADKHGLKVIEDCAQAHGAKWNGRSVGTFGDIGTWSFCQDKIMTTGGEGGMVTTNDEGLWRKMWSYKDHGKNYEKSQEKNPRPGFRWLHESFGTNARLTEMQAAIGRIQIRKMPEWHNCRIENANRIWNACRQFSWLRVPKIDSRAEHAAYKCYVFIKPCSLPSQWTRDRIVDELTSRGIPVYQGTCSEVYLEKAFDQTGWRPKGILPNAKQLGDTSLMFLVHPTLEKEHIDSTIDALWFVDELIQVEKTVALQR